MSSQKVTNANTPNYFKVVAFFFLGTLVDCLGIRVGDDGGDTSATFFAADCCRMGDTGADSGTSSSTALSAGGLLGDTGPAFGGGG